MIKEITRNQNCSKINGKKIEVIEENECEFDGLYKINGFSLSFFNLEEIKVLYKNYEENVQYKIALIEVKLNSNKINELFAQLKNDKKIIEKITEDKIIYIGFVNLIDPHIIIQSFNVTDFPCVVVGIKNGIFFRRNILQNIDWTLINNFESLKKEVNSLKEEVEEVKKTVEKNDEAIKEEVEELKVQISDINKKLDILLNHEVKDETRKNYLNKKRKKKALIITIIK